MTSFFATVEADIAAVESWITNSSSLGAELVTVVNGAWSAFEAAAESNAGTIFKTMVTAALGGLATGGEAGAITAALTSGRAALQAAGANVTTATLSYLSAQATATATSGASAAVANGTPTAVANGTPTA